jgi:CelD/BcsL family acetyltransferase involved in cellulose biosynthesis
MTIRVYRISCRNELLGLRQEWFELLSAADNASLPLTPDWVLAWWDNFGKDAELAVGCVRLDGKLVAIAPLISQPSIHAGLSVNSLELMSNGYSPHGDLLLSNMLSDGHCGRVVKELLGSHDCDVFWLGKLRADSRILSKDAQQELHQHPSGIQDSLTTPLIHIAGKWEDFLAGLSASSRKNIRRRVRSAENTPGFRIERIVLRSSDDDAVDEMIAVSARSWKAQSGADLTGDAAGRSFLLQLIDTLGPSGEVQIFFAKLHDQTIAYELLFGYNATVFPLRADFDSQYSKMSPGTVLLYHVLKHLFKQRHYQTYDCCADDYPYLRQWTKDQCTHKDLTIYKRSLKARILYDLKFNVAPVYRRLYRAVTNRGQPD